MQIRSVILALLLSALALHPYRALAQADVAVGNRTSVSMIMPMGMDIIISMHVLNKSGNSASMLLAMCGIYDTRNDSLVWFQEMAIEVLLANQFLIVRYPLPFRSLIRNTYRLRFEVFSGSDPDVTDNSRTITFETRPLAPGVFSFEQLDLIEPDSVPNSDRGRLRLHVPPRSKVEWLNVVGWHRETMEPKWIARNLPLLRMNDSFAYSYRLDLGMLGVEPGVDVDTLDFSISISDSAFEPTYSKSDWTEAEFVREGMGPRVRYPIGSDSVVIPDMGVELEQPLDFGGPPSRRVRLPRRPIIRDSLFRRNTPNIDLNRSRHRPSNDPRYAGDKRACGPAAAANSLEWMDQADPRINSGLELREKLVLLSNLMNRSDERGVTPEQMITGKLRFIDSLKLPISVKFQSVDVAHGPIFTPGKNDGHFATNHSGPNRIVTADWLVQELQDSEDVEVLVNWEQTKGHVMVLSGVVRADSELVGLWFTHDSKQDRTGGLEEEYFEIASNGRTIAIKDFASTRTLIHSAVSESYDPNVRHSTLPPSQGKVEQASFKGAKNQLHSRHGLLSLKSPPHDSMRWANMAAWHIVSATPQWLVRNMPILPSSDTQETSKWIDLGMAGAQDGQSLDSLGFYVWISENPFDSIASQKYYRKETVYKTTVTLEVNPPHPLPSELEIVPFSGRYVKATVLIDMPVRRTDSIPNIDLDSSRYNPVTVPGYAGDFNACAPAGTANSLHWLDRDPRIDTRLDLREKLYLMSAMMQRMANRGVSDERIVKGKLAFIDSLKLPVAVKFQSLFVPLDSLTFSSPDTRYDHRAYNMTHLDSAAKSRISSDWILKEMQDSEDVEIAIDWYADTGAVGSHVVNLTGVMPTNQKLTGIWVSDDLDQQSAGGVREVYYDLDDTSYARAPMIVGWSAGHRAYITAVYSESYDSTIRFATADVRDRKRPVPSGLEVRREGNRLFVTVTREGLEHPRLLLYDIEARLMADLSDALRSSGVEMEWSLEGLANGTYLLVLFDGERIEDSAKFAF